MPIQEDSHGATAATPVSNNTDGSITCGGYTIPPGAAQSHDVARIIGDDPKVPYLIVARYQGDRGVCRRWPVFAALAGLGSRS
jgi:hypothetical protein